MKYRIGRPWKQGSSKKKTPKNKRDVNFQILSRFSRSGLCFQGHKKGLAHGIPTITVFLDPWVGKSPIKV